MKALTLRAGAGSPVANTLGNKLTKVRWWIGFFLLATVPAGYFYFQDRQVPASLQSGVPSIEVTDSEILNPQEYVTGQVKMRRNFFNEIIIEGSLRNIAKYTNFRDPVLHVDFFSNSGTILFTKDYEVKGLLRPNGFMDYKFRNPPSDDVYRIVAGIRAAEACKP